MNEKLAGSGTFETKIKDITEYLKSSVITPAEEEKNKLLSEANAERDRILAAAKAEAERIIKSAELEAKRTKENLESSLRMSAKQSVAALKLTLEKEILAKSAAALKTELGDEKALRDFITEAVKVYVGRTDAPDVQVAFSKELRPRLESFMKSQIAVISGGKVTLSDSTIPAGFSFMVKDSGVAFDFSHEALAELLGTYLRPELRKYLFQ